MRTPTGAAGRFNASFRKVHWKPLMSIDSIFVYFYIINLKTIQLSGNEVDF